MKRIELTPEMTAAYKKSLLQTFKAFDYFCRKHGITYYAGGGTLIGAVRHKGIIPWDDDIDVLMLKEDYDKFIALKQECSNSDYRILDYHDSGYYLPYAKFVDANTTIWEVKEFPYVIGTFIDVFPLYHSYGNVNEVQLQVYQYKKAFFNYLLGIRAYSIKELLYNIKGKHLHDVLDWFKGVFYCKRNVNSLIEKFSSIEKKISALQEGEYLIHYYTTYSIKQELYKKEWFKDVVELPFEDMKILVPIGYHEYLVQMYGDYMTPPPIEKQVSHHYLRYIDLTQHLSMEQIKKQLQKLCQQ